MATWFTADLHFGHTNIIRYCDRPFIDVAAMNRAMIENWNRVVTDHDTIWVLGDFALGTIADTLPIAAQLNGHKILLAGNHDRCWVGHGHRHERWITRDLDAGFDEIIQRSTTLELEGFETLLCHFPYRGDSQDSDRFLEHRPVDDGAWLLHGHVHERWARHDRMVNVGVDAHDFTPISSAAIATLMRAGPATIPTPSEGIE